MSADADDPGEAASTEERIMDATFCALLEHGYTDLSIARIADEFEMSKSSLYYHYDSKDDLLVSFLSFAVDRFEESLATEEDDPMARLELLVERLLPLDPDEEQRRIAAVMSELRSEAVTNPAFREQFTEMDDLLVDTVRDIVREGIEDGSFREVDPTRVAEHVVATVNGARTTRSTTNREGATAAVRVSLASYLDATLRGRR